MDGIRDQVDSQSKKTNLDCDRPDPRTLGEYMWPDIKKDKALDSWPDADR